MPRNSCRIYRRIYIGHSIYTLEIKWPDRSTVASQLYIVQEALAMTRSTTATFVLLLCVVCLPSREGCSRRAFEYEIYKQISYSNARRLRVWQHDGVSEEHARMTNFSSQSLLKIPIVTIIYKICLLTASLRPNILPAIASLTVKVKYI